MCEFSEFWGVFLFVGVISGLIVIAAPTSAQVVGTVSGVICLVAIVLLAVAGGAKSDLRCKEGVYQATLDKRTELVRECPNREKPGCQLRWIKYQQDSLATYLRLLQ